MNKIAVIVNSEDLSWVSCKAISSNLHSSVRRINSKNIKTQFFKTTPREAYDSIHWGHSQLKSTLDEIIKFNPDVVYLPDHLPHPAQILIPLLKLHPPIAAKKFIVHAYGDFSIYPDLWELLGREMRGLKLSILASSTKQSAYLDYFLRSSLNTPKVIPFSVDCDTFEFSEKKRIETRKKHKIKSDETVFIYTGRISLQKNVDVLIHAFEKIEKVNNKVRLLILGDFDDIGSPNLGHTTNHGYLFQKIDSVLVEMNPSTRNKIHFLGPLPRKNLADYLSAADIFISLSTYHDEDYGMSPAEALASGLPAILTDWGGYSDFANYTDDVALVDVNLKLDEITINLEDVVRAYIEISKSKMARLKRAKNFSSSVSVDAVARKLTEEFTRNISPFEGFNYKLENWILEQKSRFKNPINTSSDSFYNELYQAYAEKSR